MPYNNTPITPAKEVTGTVSLPLARVKKIIAADDDITNCSNNASFVMTVATELFLQYLVDQSYNFVKSERKPRRNIQYRDVANAVARVENLEFLADVVPKTTQYRQFKQKQAAAGQAGASAATSGPAAGQGTLDAHMGVQSRVDGFGLAEPRTNGLSHVADPEAMDVDDAEEEDHESPDAGSGARNVSVVDDEHRSTTRPLPPLL